jgi:predicted transcriptional regulator
MGKNKKSLIKPKKKRKKNGKKNSLEIIKGIKDFFKETGSFTGKTAIEIAERLDSKKSTAEDNLKILMFLELVEKKTIDLPDGKKEERYFYKPPQRFDVTRELADKLIKDALDLYHDVTTGSQTPA